MNSQKTKTNEYTLVYGKAVAGVVMEPSKEGWRVTVAWEFPKAAVDGFFALAYAVVEDTDFSFRQIIDHIADYGVDVTNLQEFKKKFPNLF